MWLCSDFFFITILQMRKLELREVKQIAKLSVVVKYWHLDSVHSCSLCGQVKKKNSEFQLRWQSR